MSKQAELIFGLVAPVGTNAQSVTDLLISELSQFGYSSHQLRISDQIQLLAEDLGVTCTLKDDSELDRIRSRMKAANDLETAFNLKVKELKPTFATENSLFALAVAREIQSQRAFDKEQEEPAALLNKANILLTLKRPEEVASLRRIYGPAFHLIGVYSAREDRKRYLVRQKYMSEEDAAALISDDEDDREVGGQRTSKAFHLSDFFIDIGKDDWRAEIGRYLDLLFSHPYHTPTKDEFAMYMAFAASLRSAQLGRQVGASIMDGFGDILSVGCNEVPKPGGGMYWAGEKPDERDHQLGSDSNDENKIAILEEILRVLPESIRQDRGLRDALQKTSLFGITEFGRAVHAEMDAILTCVRKGVTPVNSTLYATVFPCHNCARHIVASGVAKVVYIEPYPKSKAVELHSDAIAVEGMSAGCSRQTGSIPFVPYVGVSPRRYADLFTMHPTYGSDIDRKLSNGRVIPWSRLNTQLRLRAQPISYLDREQYAVTDFSQVQKKN